MSIQKFLVLFSWYENQMQKYFIRLLQFYIFQFHDLAEFNASSIATLYLAVGQRQQKTQTGTQGRGHIALYCHRTTKHSTLTENVIRTLGLRHYTTAVGAVNQKKTVCTPTCHPSHPLLKHPPNQQPGTSCSEVSIYVICTILAVHDADMLVRVYRFCSYFIV